MQEQGGRHRSGRPVFAIRAWWPSAAAAPARPSRARRSPAARRPRTSAGSPPRRRRHRHWSPTSMFTANSEDGQAAAAQEVEDGQSPARGQRAGAACHHRVHSPATSSGRGCRRRPGRSPGGDGLRRICLDRGDAAPRELVRHEVDHLGEVEHRHLPALLLKASAWVPGPPPTSSTVLSSGTAPRGVGQRLGPFARPTRIEPMKACSDSGVRS